METILNENKLLVVWQDNKDRLRYIIGELSKANGFKFHYVDGKIQKLKQKGFSNLTAFPDLEKTYASDNLFPTFAARLPDKRRSDIGEVLKLYNMDSYDGFELLRKSGGKLPTDSLEFVEPIDLSCKNIRREFYIAGMKYRYTDSADAILSLKHKMVLSYHLEPNNTADVNAVQILCQNKVIGYIPSYFAKEVTESITLQKTN